MRAGASPDFVSAVLLARPRHVSRLSLSQLEALAVEAEKTGEGLRKLGLRSSRGWLERTGRLRACSS